MIVEQIWTGNAYRNFNYLIVCPESGEALAVDPLDSERCLAAANANGWQITQILNTHEHHDHIGGNQAVVDATGANAMREGHYQHAIELFEYGLGSCADADGEAVEEVPRPVRWSHQLGEAQVAVGRHAVGRHSLEVGLQGLGHPTPSRTALLAGAISREQLERR